MMGKSIDFDRAPKAPDRKDLPEDKEKFKVDAEAYLGFIENFANTANEIAERLNAKDQEKSEDGSDKT